jgi:hypothetical protein
VSDEERTIPGKPACFDTQEQWEEWHAAAEVCRLLANKPGRAAVAYCTDCTPEYQAQMKARGRCGWPTVTFVRNHGDAVYGRRPGK